MPKFNEGKILQLPENIYGERYGMVIGVEPSAEGTSYEMAVYTGEVEDCHFCGKNKFAPVLRRFKESELKEIIGEEAEELSSVLNEQGKLYLTEPLIHASEL